MNAITNSLDRRATIRGEVDADTLPVDRRPDRSGRCRQPNRGGSAWLWMVVVIVTLAAYGCGGGDEQAKAPADDEAVAQPAPAPAPKKPKEKPKEKPEEEKVAPLPEEVAEWVKEDYYRARKEWEPRLVEAVAYLGEKFAGTEQADTAGQLLTNLLKKSEGPVPASSRRPRGMPGGSPGMMGPGMEPGMEMGSSMGMDPNMGMGSEMEEDMEDGMGDEMGMGMMGMDPGMEGGMEDGMGMDPGMEAGMEGGMGMGMGMPGDMGAGAGMGQAARGRAAGKTGGGLDPIDLIEAIVRALGTNNGTTARTTLREVVEGTFETDDNRSATLATLDTLVAHLSPEYETLLLRCLTSPEKLRELGKSGQPGGQRRPPYGQGSTSEGGSMMYPGMQGSGMASMGGRGVGPLTAEELQRSAFDLLAPKASEEMRVKLAEHLVNPNTPQEDLVLFGDYLREPNPKNLPAQLVLYLDAGMDAETKATVADNFIAFSSDALGDILGVPPEARKARRPRRRTGRGAGPGGMPGGMRSDMMMPGMGMEMEEGMEAGMEEAMGMDPSMDMESMDAAGMMDPAAGMMDPAAGMMDPSAGMAGGQQGMAGRGGQSGGSRRRSRYDTAPSGPEAGTTQAGPDAQEPPDPDQPYHLAKRMWNAELTGPLENRLNQIASLESSAQLVLLASTIPVDSMRSTLGQVLRARFEDGPAPLEAAGLLDSVVSDPGFLTVVKGLPRKEPKPEVDLTRPRLGGGRAGRRSSGRAGPGGVGDEGSGFDEGAGFTGAEGMMGPGGQRGGPPRRDPEGPGEAWMFASEDLVRVLCERFLAAARSGAAQAASQPSHGLPFELRDDATVMAEYHLDWPAGADQKLAGVPLGQLKLHYVRTEQTSKLTTLESYFKRQVGGNPDVRAIHDGSWMDSFKPVPDTDWKRSVDILLTTSLPADGQIDKKVEIPVTVDILCIDVKPPAAGE